MDAIEPGFYWVKCYGEVTLAQYIEKSPDYSDCWFVIGEETPYYSRYPDRFQVISERLIPPESV